MPRLLLVTYMFPPMGGVGVQRVARFAKYLPRSGWDVSVLTVSDPPTALTDSSLLDELSDSVRIHRVWSLEPNRAARLMHRFRRAPVENRRAVSGQMGVSGMPPGFIRFVQAFFVPDEKRLWRGRARSEGVRAVHAEHCEVVMSSGPPFTAHIVARDIARRTGTRLVVDFRDPWIGNSFFIPPTRLHAWLQARWERRVVEDASVVLVVSEPMALDLRKRYPYLPSERFVVLPNGFDSEDLPAPTEPTGALTFAYMGGFQGEIRPDTFLRGVRLAIDQGLLTADEFRLDFIGPNPESVLEAATTYDLGACVIAEGPLPHREALARAARSRVQLLVLGQGPAFAPVVTGKLPEYLGLRRTILSLVPEGAARKIVERACAGPVVAPLDVDGVARALGDLARVLRSGEPLPTPIETVVAEFDRSAQVSRLAVLLSELVNRRPAHG